VFAFIVGLSRFFGSQRRTIRRVAAFCLLVIGVHQSADLLDDSLYLLLDRIDLFLDQSVFSLCEWLSSKGAFDALEGARKAENFSAFFNEEGKDLAAKWIALVLELFIDIVLLEFVWGHASEENVGFFAEFKRSAIEIKNALWPLDLERLAVPIILFCFACTGALYAGTAGETIVNEQFTNYVPDLVGAANITAFLGLVTAGVFLMRFLPDLLQGAILRSAKSAEAFRQKQIERTIKGPAWWQSFRRIFTRAKRGWFLAFVVLPLALFGFARASAFMELAARVGGAP